MGMGGVFREIVAPSLLVVTEKFDDSWYPGEALNTTEFFEKSGVTKTKITVQFMEHGMAAGYNRLEQLLISLLPEGAART